MPGQLKVKWKPPTCGILPHSGKLFTASLTSLDYTPWDREEEHDD